MVSLLVHLLRMPRYRQAECADETRKEVILAGSSDCQYNAVIHDIVLYKNATWSKIKQLYVNCNICSFIGNIAYASIYSPVLQDRADAEHLLRQWTAVCESHLSSNM